MDTYDIELKDSRQNMHEMMQNVRINVIGGSTGSSSTWPQAISCSECLYSDGGITQSGHATCCIANLIAVSQSLTFQPFSHQQFYHKVVVIADDDGPGEEKFL